MCAAKLMVLDRMLVFAAPGDEKRRAAAGRIVTAVVVGNAVGLAALAVADYNKAAEAGRTASAYYAVNNTEDGYTFDLQLLRDQEQQRAGSISSVQRFAEVAVLLLIVVAFAAVGVLCARILNTRLKPVEVDAGYDAFMATVGRTLRRHMLGTTAFVFVTFLLRSMYSIINAVSIQLGDYSKRCPEGTSRCDASCYNVYTHIAQWMTYTPSTR